MLSNFSGIPDGEGATVIGASVSRAGMAGDGHETCFERARARVIDMRIWPAFRCRPEERGQP
jgi:hypothetical protein